MPITTIAVDQAQRRPRFPRMPRIPLPSPYKVDIVLDSISAATQMRLTTFALTYWRAVHSELMTHRAFSRNSASSRAIPAAKMRKIIEETPALPVWWGQNQSGMQARKELPNNDEMRRLVNVWDESGDEILERRIETPMEYVKRRWLEARDTMLAFSDKLSDLSKVHPDWVDEDGKGLGFHKQCVNRLTECWMPITVLVTSCTYANWFHLRDHKDAMPEIQIIATEMHYQYLESKPRELNVGEWHLPYISEDDRDGVADMFDAGEQMTVSNREEEIQQALRAISTGRCARVSYLTHEGKRDLIEDVKLHDRLKSTTESEDPGHFSPFEHPAQCIGEKKRIGNFTGWLQYRKTFRNEAGPEEEST